MSSNMYIQFDKVEGEATDSAHDKWIEILSWSHGFSQPASPVRGSSGSTVEKANHSDLTITKYLDSATDDLIKACWQGKQFEKVTMDCYRDSGGEKPINYLKVEMEDVIISDFSISGGGGDLPMENLSLAYSKVTYTYTPQEKADGAKTGGAQPVSVDLKTNKVS